MSPCLNRGLWPPCIGWGLSLVIVRVMALLHIAYSNASLFLIFLFIDFCIFVYNKNCFLPYFMTGAYKVHVSTLLGWVLNDSNHWPKRFPGWPLKVNKGADIVEDAVTKTWLYHNQGGSCGKLSYSWNIPMFHSENWQTSVCQLNAGPKYRTFLLSANWQLIAISYRSIFWKYQ